MMDFHEARVDLLRQRVAGIGRLLPLLRKEELKTTGHWVTIRGAHVWISDKDGEQHDPFAHYKPVQAGTYNSRHVNEHAGRIAELSTEHANAEDNVRELQDANAHPYDVNRAKIATAHLKQRMDQAKSDYKFHLERHIQGQTQPPRSAVDEGTRRAGEQQVQEEQQARSTAEAWGRRLEQEAQTHQEQRQHTQQGHTIHSAAQPRAGGEQQQQQRFEQQQAAGGATSISRHPLLSPLPETAGLTVSAARVTHRLYRAADHLARIMAHGSGAISTIGSDWGTAGQQLQAMHSNIKSLRIELGHLLQERKTAEGTTHRSELDIAIRNIRNVLTGAHSTLKAFSGYMQRAKSTTV